MVHVYMDYIKIIIIENIFVFRELNIKLKKL